MAKTVTIEFTDAQWEVVKDNYPGFMLDSEDEVLTPELLASHLLRDIKMYVDNDIRLRQADISVLSVFDE